MLLPLLLPLLLLLLLVVVVLGAGQLTQCHNRRGSWQQVHVIQWAHRCCVWGQEVM